MQAMSRRFGTWFVRWRMCREHLVVMPRKSLSLIGLRVVGQMHLASMRYDRPQKR